LFDLKSDYLTAVIYLFDLKSDFLTAVIYAGEVMREIDNVEGLNLPWCT